MNPKITIVGRLGTDPDPIGTGVRMRVATSDRAKNTETGEWEDKNTSWWTVKAWKNLAELAKANLKKGQEVTITGTIMEDSWTGDDGVKKTVYEIVADNIGVTLHSLNKSSGFSSSSSPEDDPWNSKPVF